MNKFVKLTPVLLILCMGRSPVEERQTTLLLIKYLK